MTIKQPHTHTTWIEWLEALSAPLLGNKCGEDLKYDETFKSLKASSSGVGEVDFKVMFIQASDLLNSQSKDLRLTSYLALAATSEFGVIGLTHSLLLFNRLLTTYTDEVHPTKARMRNAVNTWFLQQQERLKGIAEAHTTEAEQWPELIAALTQYNEQCVPLLDSESGPLSTLNEWALKQQKRNPVAVVEVPKPKEVNSSVKPEDNQAKEQQSQVQSQQLQATSSQSNPVSVSDVSTDSAYLTAIRQLLNFDKEQNNIERVIKLSRAARWSKLSLPVSDNGKTRLPAPRAAAFAPIENALAADEPQQALNLAEALFMEGAMQFNLNLQILSLSALKKINKPHLVNWLEQQLVGLVEQFPSLSLLQYDDGSPLCSSTNKEFLKELAHESSGEKTAVLKNEFEEQYKALSLDVEKGQLAMALNHVDSINILTDFDKAQAQLLKAKLLIKAEHYEHALALLSILLEKIKVHELAQWQQRFCMEVWRFSKQCYASLSQAPEDEMSLAAKHISQQMMVTNPAEALAWV
ncbi:MULTISPECIES: type VI secretion system domain-containing protein [unclassified Pseudoalteromonas]|jgi:type VI secretion system ImpA/VasJ family protein|uniref:type VI secretion system domain-containing protein n=1 Tax=unclassified Pseudoalteromonas TaxID=194690 RepID=UPI00235A064F|nr:MULTISPECIES: type VI secretion system domain-containing protein [unclassified Pseudoalteromonas]MDC9501604.1 type VI secretion system domain-containing protein [Pseudoalteromonas sp. Angola-18]MDC9530718.1 type VI secretion system domain-containing protein [Pseudoalteromonas sp. Angola-7]